MQTPEREITLGFLLFVGSLVRYMNVLQVSSADLRIFMPRLAPYLQRRGSGFTFRISVSPELRKLIGTRSMDV